METAIKKALLAKAEERNNEPHRRHLGASQIGGECLRSIWYNFYWVMKVNFSGRMHMLFQEGFAFEDWIMPQLRAAGYTVAEVDEAGNQYRLGEEGLLCGSCDGYIFLEGEWAITEMKTHNDKSFKALVKDEVKKSKPQHFVQMQVYMGYAGLKKALYIAKNKNDSDLYFEIIEFDQAVFDDARMKAHVIRTNGPPKRVSEKPTFYKCKWCDFSDICHEDKIPEVNCRTCINFSLDQVNQPMCKGILISEAIELSGCEDHVFRPDLTPWEPVVGNDKAVTYPNGIANCGRAGFPELAEDVRAVFTSHELHNCHKWSHVAAAAVVKAETGGEVVSG